MIIYSVTIHISHEKEKEFVEWMHTVHIPEVLQTGKFTSAYFSKVLSHKDESGSSYSTQYYCKNKDVLDLYYKEDAPKLREKGLEKFGDTMQAFRTELQLINVYSVQKQSTHEN